MLFPSAARCSSRCPASTEHFRIADEPGPFACQETPDVLQRDVRLVPDDIARGACQVRCHDQIGQAEQFVPGWDRLHRIDVQPRAGDPLFLQCVIERVVVQDLCPGSIDQVGRPIRPTVSGTTLQLMETKSDSRIRVSRSTFFASR